MKGNRFLTLRSLLSVGFPLGVVLIQALLRGLAKIDFDCIGITLSSIAIGQVFPFIIFESFLLSKIFGLREESQYVSDGKITITYSIENKASLDKVKRIRYYSYLLFLIILLLFIATIYLNLTGYIFWHIISGSFACLLTWHYNITY